MYLFLINILFELNISSPLSSGLCVPWPIALDSSLRGQLLGFYYPSFTPLLRGPLALNSHIA